jgi:hypothetical protein
VWRGGDVGVEVAVAITVPPSDDGRKGGFAC